MRFETGKELVRQVTSAILGTDVHVIAVRGGTDEKQLDVLVPEALLGRAIGRDGETVRALEHILAEMLQMNRPPRIRFRAIEKMSVPFALEEENEESSDLDSDVYVGETPRATPVWN